MINFIRLSVSITCLLVLLGCSGGVGNRSGMSDEEKAYRCLEDAGRLNENEQYDSARIVIAQGLTYTAASDSTLGMLNAEMSAACNLSGDMRQALVYGLRALSLCRDDAESFVILSGNIGIVYRRLGMNDSAAICYKNGVEVAFKNRDYDGMAYLYNNLSVLYCEMERYAESISYALKAQDNARKADDEIELYSAMANEGVNYVKQGNNLKAVRLLSKVFDKAEKMNSTPLKLKTISHLLSAYREMGDYKHTDEYLAKAEIIAESFPKGSIAVAGIYETKMNIQLARKDYADALATSQQLESFYGFQVIPLYKLRDVQAQCYAGMGNHAEAYRMEREAMILSDSLSGADVKKQLSEYTIRFRTQEKELEISRLQEEKAKDRALMLLIVLGLTLVITVLVLVLIWINHRRKMRRKQTEIDLARKYIDGMESERARFARDIHDGVCNDLLALGMSLRNDNADINSAVCRVGELRTSLRRMSHDMMPPSFKYADLNEILCDYLSHLVKPDTLQIDYLAEGDGWTGIPHRVAYQLYRIVQEAVANIIRHSSAGHASVSLKYDGVCLTLAVSDDGCGIQDKEMLNGGIGMRSIRDRADSIGARLNWHSGTEGTRIEIKLQPTDSRSFRHSTSSFV